MVGGPSIGKQVVITKSAKVMISFVRFGFSIKIAAHMYKVYTDQKFTSFDFGPKLNKQVLGQETPINFLDHFDQIDIPITYYVSLDDNLTRADDIMIAYKALYAANKKLANIKIFNGFSHLDFTYINHHSMIMEILKSLKGEDLKKKRNDQHPDDLIN